MAEQLNMHNLVLCELVQRDRQRSQQPAIAYNRSAPAPQSKLSYNERRQNNMTSSVLLMDRVPVKDDEMLEQSVLALLNDKFTKPNGKPFDEGDIDAAYYVGKANQHNKRTLKVVFNKAWYKRSVFEQRDIKDTRDLY